MKAKIHAAFWSINYDKKLTQVRIICGTFSGIIDMTNKQNITCKKCKSAMLDGF